MTINLVPRPDLVPPRPGITEEQFLQQVRDLAKTLSWATYHTRASKGSDRGWPDLVLASSKQRRLLFVELKTATGKLTAHQRKWLGILAACGQEAAVWRPADMPTIIRVLRGERIPPPSQPKENAHA